MGRFGKLARYEDVEEQGRLIVLPCCVGDRLYAITRGQISTFCVEHFEKYRESQVWIAWRIEDGITGHFRIDGIPSGLIGHTVFLSREEAEKALEGMK